MQMLLPGYGVPCPIIDAHGTPAVRQNESDPTSDNFYLYGYINSLQHLFHLSFDTTHTKKPTF
jgi:hypothetical protein